MLSFTTPAGRFQVRVAAIVMHGGRVLLHRALADRFWALPGGRLEQGEDASAAVRRELHEELGVAAIVGALRFVVENFFEYRGAAYHEIGLYFDATLEADAAILDERGDFTGREHGEPLVFRWLEVDELGAAEVRPKFLVDALVRREQGVVHLVQRDAGCS